MEKGVSYRDFDVKVRVLRPVFSKDATGDSIPEYVYDFCCYCKMDVSAEAITSGRGVDERLDAVITTWVSPISTSCVLEVDGGRFYVVKVVPMDGKRFMRVELVDAP